jgi:hypothetical protein
MGGIFGSRPSVPNRNAELEAQRAQAQREADERKAEIERKAEDDRQQRLQGRRGARSLLASGQTGFPKTGTATTLGGGLRS